MALRYITTVLLVLSSALLINAYSAGAPRGACEDMTPQHHVDGQTSPVPYQFILSKRSIRAGDTIQLTIKGKSASDKIKGLLVQARVGHSPVGMFSVPSNSPYVQTVDCGNGSHVSIDLYVL